MGSGPRKGPGGISGGLTPSDTTDYKTATGNATSSISGSGNMATQSSSVVSGSVQVVYHYTPGNDIPPGNYDIHLVQEPPGYIPGQTTNNNINPLPNSRPRALTSRSPATSRPRSAPKARSIAST